MVFARLKERKMIKKTIVLLLFLVNFAYGAEFLLYKGPHWMDALTEEQVAKLTPEKKAKYDSRYRVGDVVEVQPDGQWPNVNETTPFYVIKIKGLDVNDVKHYMEPVYDLTNRPDPNDPNDKRLPRKIYQRRFNFRIADLPTGVKNNLETTHVLSIKYDNIKAIIDDKQIY
jgi:hypothetical protein